MTAPVDETGTSLPGRQATSGKPTALAALVCQVLEGGVICNAVCPRGSHLDAVKRWQDGSGSLLYPTSVQI
jgi:hypothetical protein